MIALLFFRWLYGYFDFTVSGRFPERFLNIAAKKGIRLWNTNGGKETLNASAGLRDMELVIKAADNSGCRAEIKKQHGLPELCKKYANRFGLLAGAIIGAVLCVYMSGFIWNIKINVPDDINEYEVRRELSENGLYEGVKYRYDDISRTERRVKIIDSRISWISINVYGTNAVVEISTKKDNKDRRAEKDSEITPLNNMISKADGTVTRVEAEGGKPLVKPGDGVHRGELLISGIIPYNDGSSGIADNRGKVFAKTYRRISFSLPEKIKRIQYDIDGSVRKTDIIFSGIDIPLTINSSPLSPCCKRIVDQKVTMSENDLPFTIRNEEIIPYSEYETIISEQEAEKELETKYMLYKMFLSSENDITILSEKIKYDKIGGSYILTSLIETEENICEPRTAEIVRSN